MPRSVVVSGIHRGGTTWVGLNLAHDVRTNYYGEPFAPPNVNWYLADTFVKTWFYYFTSHDKISKNKIIKHGLGLSFTLEDLKRHVQNSHKLKTRLGWCKRYIQYHYFYNTVIVKDPSLIFNLDWIYETFDIPIVLVIRHPAAFVESIIRMHKNRGWDIGFDHWLLSQDELMNEKLRSFHSLMKEYSKSDSIIEKAAFYWVIIHEIIRNYQKKYSQWIFVKHEDLAADALTQFKELYDKLDLNFSIQTQKSIKKLTEGQQSVKESSQEIHILERKSIDSIKRWRTILSEEEIRNIKRITDSTSSFFYAPDSW